MARDLGWKKTALCIMIASSSIPLRKPVIKERRGRCLSTLLWTLFGYYYFLISLTIVVIFCPNCGTVLQTDAKFCVECGTQVVRDSVDKRISFEEFMASRTNGDSSFSSAASSAGEAARHVQFQAARRNKQKERSSHFKSKGKYNKKADETVKVGSQQMDS